MSSLYISPCNLKYYYLKSCPSLYLSVSMRAVIGQFCWPYVTVRPANFENFFFHSPDYPQRYNKYLTNLVFSVGTKLRILAFSCRFMSSELRAWAISEREKNSVRNSQYGSRTRLVRGMYFLLQRSIFMKFDRFYTH